MSSYRFHILSLALALSSNPAAGQIKPAKVPVLRTAPVAKQTYAANFSLGSPQCGANLTTASVPVSARVYLPPSMSNTTKVRYDIHVNGAATGAATASVVKGEDGRVYFNVTRTVTLRTNSAQTHLRLYVDGNAFGIVETHVTPCQLRQGTRESRDVPVLPIQQDLAIGPWIIAVYSPPRPVERPQSNWPFAPTLPLPSRTHGISPRALIENDFRRTMPLYEQLRGACAGENDAFVTMTFLVSIVARGISARSYFPHETKRQFVLYSDEKLVETPGLYWDTRGGSFPAGEGERPFPSGYEWAEFDRVLPCTRNGIFEFTIDRDNRLRESDETNNTVRIRYSTVWPE